jgi:hypothetical protein
VLCRLLSPFRNRFHSKRAPTRRTRWYRPYCEPLEDRCLLTIYLNGPSDGLVGAPGTWTATTSDHGDTPVYQFSIEPAGGVAHVVRDFSTNNSFT